MRHLALGLALVAFSTGCRDLSSFTTDGDVFTGSVVDADFVRAGVAADTKLCLNLDTNHFQDGPGVLSTNDGRFHAAPLRPIPQIWYDPLSTLAFGEGRLKNIVYVVSATSPFDDGNGNDVFAVLSLMQAGGVEVRLLRGAPSVDAGPGNGQPVFAIFALDRQKGPCSF